MVIINQNIKSILSIAGVFFVMVLTSSCDKDVTPKTITDNVKFEHFENHDVEFDYPKAWRVSSDMLTTFGDITVILSTNILSQGATNVFIKIFPKEKSGDLVKLVKTYDQQYYIPVFSKPKPEYQWSKITRNEHKGMRKTHNSLNPDLKPFIKEYFRFQLGDRTALVVMESNQNEYNKYGKELVIMLNTIKNSDIQQHLRVDSTEKLNI